MTVDQREQYISDWEMANDRDLSPIYKQKLLEQLNMKQLIVKLNDTLSYQAITVFK